jgi:hypothetical protein
MKQLILILGVAVTLIGIVAGGVFIVSSLRGPDTEPPATSNGTFPNYTSTTGVEGGVVEPGSGEGVVRGSGATYAAKGGYTIVGNDIKKDPDLVADQYNPGYYYIGYHYDEETTEEPPYVIQYIESTQFFNITLLKEPLAETRRSAEQYLLQRLGVTEAELCVLQYTVAVPNRVNSFYAGESLGFSFCPGAKSL